jgi:hypothetical protein
VSGFSRTVLSFPFWMLHMAPRGQVSFLSGNSELFGDLHLTLDDLAQRGPGLRPGHEGRAHQGWTSARLDGLIVVRRGQPPGFTLRSRRRAAPFSPAKKPRVHGTGLELHQRAFRPRYVTDEATAMFTLQRSIPAVLIAAGLMAAPACATQRPYYGAQRDYRDFERRAHDDGYRRGLEQGQRDARDRRDFRVDRDRVYRDADRNRGNRDRDEYARFFRDGYRQGYTEGYNRAAQYDRRGVYPNGPVFDPGNGPRNGGRLSSSPAAQVGYRDGFEAGREDANDRGNYDPRRSKRYRDGDRDYDNRYGSRDQYKQDYRAAFVQGYEEGFRNFRR